MTFPVQRSALDRRRRKVIAFYADCFIVFHFFLFFHLFSFFFDPLGKFIFFASFSFSLFSSPPFFFSWQLVWLCRKFQFFFLFNFVCSFHAIPPILECIYIYIYTSYNNFCTFVSMAYLFLILFISSFPHPVCNSFILFYTDAAEIVDSKKWALIFRSWFTFISIFVQRL